MSKQIKFERRIYIGDKKGFPSSAAKDVLSEEQLNEVTGGMIEIDNGQNIIYAKPGEIVYGTEGVDIIYGTEGADNLGWRRE